MGNACIDMPVIDWKRKEIFLVNAEQKKYKILTFLIVIVLFI